MPYADLSTASTIDPRTLSARLDAVLPGERQLAVDSGNFMGYPAGYLSVPDAGAFCFTQSFQSIGLGLATAIGAALAAPDRLPVLGTGDGGFLMAIAELETAVRLGLGLLIVVYDDARTEPRSTTSVRTAPTCRPCASPTPISRRSLVATERTG